MAPRPAMWLRPSIRPRRESVDSASVAVISSHPPSCSVMTCFSVFSKFCTYPRAHEEGLEAASARGQRSA